MTAGTASPAAGAPAHDLAGWHAIPWPTAHQNVRRLQARIVKATQEGRGGKVKALQHLLTHSFSGKAIAVKRVTDNHGKHLSQAGASPRFDRGETVSRKGQTRGLSRVTSNGHARFLGGRAAATLLLLPGRAGHRGQGVTEIYSTRQ